MLDQESRDAGQAERAPRASEALYTRPMPGGGYVRVELVMSDRGAVKRGRVVIEERSSSRGEAGAPIVVEEIDGADENDVLERLFRIARDNAAIARRVLQRRSAVRRAD